MEDSLETRFPQRFGASPDDFLERYESLIYKIIFQKTREDSRFDAEDLFNEFFIHLSENNFKRLRSFRGESRPTTYLGKILRNFLYDRYRKKECRQSEDSLEEMEEEGGKNIPAPFCDPTDILTGELIHEALKETFSKLSHREKLIFDLFTDEEMPAKEIADLLDIKVKSVYKNHEKVKKILREELRKRGIEDF